MSLASTPPIVPTSPDSAFDKSSIHQLVLDLRTHRPLIYWTDFLFTTLGFWALIVFAGLEAFHWAGAALACILSIFLLYRGALFVHEIGHLNKGVLPGFEWAWNALLGWPMLFPSFFIRSHPDHHRIASYGTAQDPEYLPFANMTQSQHAHYIFSAMLTPWLLAIRALFIVPLSWLRPALKSWLRMHASRMTMNNAYQPAPNDIRLSTRHELSEIMTVVCAYGWIVASGFGALSAWFLMLLMLIQMLAHGINAWRTIHAHAYQSTGAVMSHLEQLHDSTTFKLPAALGFFLCPVGQRFHAAHHLFPYLPYHALGKAHQRLLASQWKNLGVYQETHR